MAIKQAFAILFVYLPLVAQAEILYSEGLVVIQNNDKAEIKGEICNASSKECRKVQTTREDIVIALDLRKGDLIRFSGNIGQKEVTLWQKVTNLEGGDSQAWLERVLLVLVGSVAGLIGNMSFSLFDASKKDKLAQKKLFRDWRNQALEAIRKRRESNDCSLIVDIPKGLNKTSLNTIYQLTQSLSQIDNQINARPDEKNSLLENAEKLILQ